MDDIASKLQHVKWQWVESDLGAQEQIETRIVRAARSLGLITYSDVVAGIEFQVPSLHGGCPFQIDVHNWSSLDRALLGEFLGYCSSRSYQKAGFMISALVVNKDEFEPSWHFFEWMKSLAVLPDTEEDTVIKFWAQQVNEAHKYFAKHRHL